MSILLRTQEIPVTFIILILVKLQNIQFNHKGVLQNSGVFYFYDSQSRSKLLSDRPNFLFKLHFVGKKCILQAHIFRVQYWPVFVQIPELFIMVIFYIQLLCTFIYSWSVSKYFLELLPLPSYVQLYITVHTYIAYRT